MAENIGILTAVVQKPLYKTQIKYWSSPALKHLFLQVYVSQRALATHQSV